MRRASNWLIARCLPPGERDAVIGDLTEEYERRVRPAAGSVRAGLWYLRQSLLACVHGRVSGAFDGPTRSSWREGFGGLRAFGRDVRYGARGLWRTPAFTLAAILSLAIGTGASTAIFSVANPVLLQPLPYPQAERVLLIWYAGAGGARVPQAFGTYREIETRSRSFAALAALRPWQPTLTGQEEPERLEGLRVTAAYFRTLGVRPAIGRDFDPADDRPGGANVAVLAHSLWRSRFGADPALVGREIRLNDVPYTVLGIMPAGFEDVLSPQGAVWGLLQYDPALPIAGREWGHHLRMVGRLAPGASLTATRRELDQIARSPVETFNRPAWCSMAQGLIVNELRDDLAGPVTPVLVAVIGGVALLLLIACLNVTNLLIARGGRRQADVALRAALGAGRGRLVRQFVAESLLIAGIGGLAGFGIAAAGVRALVWLAPPELPRPDAIGLDATVFLFCTGLAALTGLVVGLAPALRASRGSLGHHTARTTTGAGRAASNLRRALVVVEVALAAVLLVGAGLLWRSVDRLFAITPGFDPSRVLTMQVQLWRQFPDPGAMEEFYQRALDAVRQVPGVAGAAFVSQLPFSGDHEAYGVTPDRPDTDGRPGGAAFRYAVTPGYFEVMRIPLATGRLFDAGDATGAAVRPVLVGASLANRLFPGEDPIGRRLRFAGAPDRPWDVVVGVVGDVKQTSLALDEDAVYVRSNQWLWSDNPRWLVVRAAGDAAAPTQAIKAAVWSVDRDQPIVRVATMASRVNRSAASRGLALILFEVFGLVALVLAATGLYGVLSGSIAERTREIGVRTALGATRRAILTMVFREGLTLTVIGSVVGLAAGAAASDAIGSLLFGISRRDALTYGVVGLLLIGVSVVACWLPARRASRVDPLVTLRSDGG